MCGIIGIVGKYPATPRLVKALKRLEYRGYDSAGVATLDNGVLSRRRAPGKISNLEKKLIEAPLDGTTGIGHTRWATHGEPTEGNAHPHAAPGVAVVHNGIIENYSEIRANYAAKGASFKTETDTETIAVTISDFLQKGDDPKTATSNALRTFRGSYAIAAVFDGHDDLLVGARKGSPLVIGIGEGEMYLGSDALALSPYTRQVIYLEEGDWCVLSKTTYEIYDAEDNPVERLVQSVDTDEDEADKGNYAHFMLKEIHEQPKTIDRTLKVYTHPVHGTISLPREALDAIDLGAVKSVFMVSCGTAHYATRVGEYWMEQIAGIPCKTDIASEFRYRQPALGAGALAIFVSQSGETADTLAALRYCKSAGVKTLAIVNVPTSSIAREADIVLPTMAGPEIGVASTKAFTSQLVVLLAFALSMAHESGQISAEEFSEKGRTLIDCSTIIEAALDKEEDLEQLATHLEGAESAFYLGRGVYYPLALEGALKIKEISYIHAEGFASGELKHGPIALITENTPVVFVAPNDELYEKSLSNLQEVAARRGPVILISDEEGVKDAAAAPTASIAMPAADTLIAPIVYAVALQLLAYYAAVQRGTDVDQPRNLAKSVTVE